MIYAHHICKKTKHMKWIAKIVAGLIILSLVAFKLLTPNQTLLSKIASETILVLFLLVLGEQLIVYAWVILTKAINTYRITHDQKSILKDFVGLESSY